MKTRLMVIIFLLLATTIFVPQTTSCAEAALIVDPGGGGDFSTLSLAVLSASPGSTIVVLAGDYNESVVVDKPLNITGAGPNATKIHIWGEFGLHITGSNVSISGISFNGRGSQGQMGMRVSNSTGSKIKNNTFTNLAFGLYVENSKDTVIEGCFFQNSSRGIYGTMVENAVLANNTLTRNGGGIELFRANLTTIQSSVFSFNNGNTISLSSSSGCTLENNILEHNYGHGIRLFQSNNNTMKSNRMVESSFPAFYLWLSNHNTMRDNSIVCAEDGVYLKTSDNNSITHNLFENTLFPVRMWNSRNNLVTDNTFASTLPGFPVNSEPPALVSASAISETRVELVFSKPINPMTAVPSMFSLSKGSVFGADMLENTLVLHTTGLPPMPPYTISIDAGIEDIYGNIMPARTEPLLDKIPPRIVSASTTSTQHIKLVFSEPVQPMNKNLFWVSSSPISSITHETNTVTIMVENAYPPHYTPTVSAFSGIKDIAGNLMEPVVSMELIDMVPNVPPVLLQPLVYPPAISEGEPIVLSVVFSDEDNEAPAWVKARIVGPTNHTVDMEWEEGDYALGVVASASLDELRPGSYIISFSCFDGKNLHSIPSALTLHVEKLDRRNVSITTNTPVLTINPSSSRDSFIAFAVTNTGDVDFSCLVYSSLPVSWKPSMQGAYFLEKGVGYHGSLYFTIPRELASSVYNHSLTFTPVGGGTSGVLQFSIRIVRGEPGSVSISAIDPVKGRQGEVLVVVENTGSGVLEGANLILFEGGNSLANVEIPAVQPGENATLRIPWVPASKGSVLLSAIVSSDSGGVSSFRTVTVADVPIRFSLFSPERFPVLLAGIVLSSIGWIVVLGQVVKHYRKKRRREQYVI